MTESKTIKGFTSPPSVHVWADVAPLPEFKIELGTGAGAGGGAVLVSEACLDFLSIGVALASASIPAGPLLRECQGLQVLAMARAQAAKLAKSMQRDGRGMSSTSQDEAAAAGAAAVVAWRNGAKLDGAKQGARGVCWRAVVRAVAMDSFGESIEHWRDLDGGADCFDKLTGSALPLPALVGDGSRDERATRLLFERARAKRPALLARRVESLKAGGGRGKRAESIDRVHRAAILLLHGEDMDTAAQAAGFKPSGSGRQAVRAGDMLMRAARRLGFRVQFTVRDRQQGERNGGGGAFVPMSSATATAYGFKPSASLPLQDGRGGKRRVPLIRRLQRARVRRQRLAEQRATRTHKQAKARERAQARARVARRADKAAGWFTFGGPCADFQSAIWHDFGVWFESR
jgi:hypothetical protein